MLLDYIKGQRWFRGKARDAWAAEIQDIIPVHFDIALPMSSCCTSNTRRESRRLYIIPLVTAPAGAGERDQREIPSCYHRPFRQRGGNDGEILYDAMVDRDFDNFLLPAIKRRRSFKGTTAKFPLRRPISSSSIPIADTEDLAPEPIKGEQTIPRRLR